MSVKAFLRSLIEGRGYSLFKEEYMPYGIKPFVDIDRLSRRLNYPIRTFFDVGANDGDTAVSALKAFPSCRIICFEPHPATFAQLGERLAKERRVELHNIALGNEAGKADLHEYEISVLNSLVPNSPFVSVFKWPETASVVVDVTTLDSFCSTHGIDEIDVLKIDTEGFDAMVLRGAKDMLARRAIKFVYAEFSHITPREGMMGGSLSELAECVSSADLRFIASYTDYTLSEGGIFASCNALFALPPD